MWALSTTNNGQGGGQGAGGGETPDSDGGATLRSRISMYAVHAEGRVESGAVYARDAVLRMRGGSGTPYIVLAWRQGRRELFTPGVDEDLEEIDD